MTDNLGVTERQLIEVRQEKLEKIRELGLNPYPAKANRSHMVSAVISDKDKLIESREEVKIAGRLSALRGHGKLVFADVVDESGKIQVIFRIDNLPEENFKLVGLLDIGDFIQVSGPVFVTNAGEFTVEVHDLKLLAKALRPMPEVWFGLKDEETRLRKRYLDFNLNPELRDLFRKKAKFWQATRDFLISKGFLEVETPVLETTAGGADANPFITHHDALDIDVYLRISMGELWQKRLMVAGFDKTFEIGRQFRNEGISREHLQDYSQMEFYWGYANYEDSMALVQEMYRYIAKEAFDTTKFHINGFDVDLAEDWPRIDYTEVIKDKLGIDVLASSDDLLVEKIKELHLDYDSKDHRGRLIDTLWKHIRKDIGGPAFLINHPVEVSPLSKRKEDDPRLVERFQVILAGSENGNGYSELNDPIDQAGRFLEQAKMREEGDTEAQMHDRDFVEALEYGMPPTSGFGFSERLFSFFANRPVREAVMFPLMRPLGSGENKIGRAKETKEVVVVLNKASNLSSWQAANTVAHLSASFAARSGSNLFVQDKVTTKDGTEINLNIQHAIMIKEAESSEAILGLIRRAKESELEVYEFTREMLETTNDKKVDEITRNKSIDEIEFLGVLVFGKKSIVDEITQPFNLMGVNYVGH